ncbi:MAG: hypothetical protein QOH49_3443 [Acidobacteriota bacterium]|nr:hypothetical protein [Acidobacteriota bacterium]
MSAHDHDRSAGGWLLGHGIRGLLRCDEAEVVEGIARYVMSQHRSLRVGSALMERARATPLPAATALLGGLTRFLEVRSSGSEACAVWVARLGNERRAVGPLLQLLPEADWTEWKFRRRPDAAALRALAALARRPTSILRAFRLARRLHRRYEFFKVLRVVELLGYYARYLALFRSGQFGLALMSSHSNPHGIAFNLAARRCGVPVVLVTHGMPVRPLAQLSYAMALVHCEAARQTYADEGCRMGRVLVYGRRQHHAPMPSGPLPERLAVGLFLCKDVHEERLRALVERLLADPRVSRVLLRPHPKNLWCGLGTWVASRGEPRLSLSPGGIVFQDIAASDFVLAGNSSVLVEAVTAGRPAAYVPGIDHGSPDLHAFVARGLVYQFEDERGFDPDAMQRFYLRPDWPTALRLFANIDEDEASVASLTRDALREVATLKPARQPSLAP